MSISPISQTQNGYLQQIFASTLQNSGAGLASSPAQADTSGLSPFAQMMSELQQLQQSDPSKYQQVTQQIATSLQSAAQTAQSDGDTTAATQLTQLANDFTTASRQDRLPSIQDLAQAIGGHHHRHHGGHSGAGSSSNSSPSSSNDALSQIVSAFQATQTQNSAFNPLGIIMNTLNSAGVTGTGQ